ncbi:MAG: efflux RND transporter permease subunit [Acidobacteria bacterium]|nr:efflux RND transporter permease subunit [Acidobacteriota bacterium]
MDELGQLAAQVAGALEKTPGTQYVTNPVRLPSSDLRVGIDREKALLLGIPTVEIDRTVRLGLAGLIIFTVVEKGKVDERLAAIDSSCADCRQAMRMIV